MKTITSGLLIGGAALAFSGETEHVSHFNAEPFAGRRTNILQTTTTTSTPTAGSSILFPFSTQQNVFRTNNGHVSFFAKAPVSDVDARTERANMTLDVSTGELKVNIDMSDFEFQNKKMGRDARRNYLEIDKIPQAGFIGKISGAVDYDKPGSYPVTATGELTIHGVERKVSEQGIVKVEKGRITINSEFNVALKDHDIETPKILGQEMTEDKVIVNIEATLVPASK